MSNQTTTKRQPNAHTSEVIPLFEIGTLLQVARSIDEPAAAVVELSILTMRPPHQIITMDLADFDWRNGACPLSGKSRETDIVYLSSAAIASVVRIVGSATGSGQVVTAGRGTPITNSHVRLDRLQKTVAAAWPGGAPVEWSFHHLRYSAASHLVDDGVNDECIAAGLGVRFTWTGKRFTPPQPRRDALGALGRWAELLSRNTARPSDK